MNFEKLSYIRNELSQKEMAEILGVSRSVYSKWEIGASIIPLTHLFDFCNYFHISLDYALDLEKNIKINNSKNKPNKILIGKRLKEFRKNNNLTQLELANFLHTTQSTISAYEKGSTLLLTAFVYQIAKNYNTSIDYLCGRDN